MTIILEGPDCTGKTTLAHILKRTVPSIRPRPKFVQSDMGGREGTPMSLMERVVLELAKNSHPGNLYDRHPLISEYIYSAVLGRRLPPMMAHPTARAIREQLLQNAIVIVCLPPFEVYEEQVLASPQPGPIHDNYMGLYTGYQAWLNHTPHPGRTYVYDWTISTGLDAMTDLCRHYLEGTA